MSTEDGNCICYSNGFMRAWQFRARWLAVASAASLQVRGTSCSPPTVRSAATVGCIDHKLQTVSVLQFLSHAATETHLPLRMHALALVNFL